MKDMIYRCLHSCEADAEELLFLKHPHTSSSGKLTCEAEILAEARMTEWYAARMEVIRNVLEWILAGEVDVLDRAMGMAWDWRSRRRCWRKL